MALDVVSAVHSLLKGEVLVPKAIMKAHKSYRKLCQDLSPQEKGASSFYLSCIYRRSIVYQYFIKGCKTFGSLPDTFSKKDTKN
jgi:hypothetical protein